MKYNENIYLLQFAFYKFCEIYPLLQYLWPCNTKYNITRMIYCIREDKRKYNNNNYNCDLQYSICYGAIEIYEYTFD